MKASNKVTKQQWGGDKRYLKKKKGKQQEGK
jgi:hypothetical protein